jgi:hypothetical protein
MPVLQPVAQAFLPVLFLTRLIHNFFTLKKE